MQKKKKKPISVASRKAKARNLQKRVCEDLGLLTGIKTGKDQLIESREMGQSGVDVKLIGEALQIIALSVECKACESWSVHSWIDQAKSNLLPNTTWILVAKRSRHEPVVFMDYKKFLEMYAHTIEHNIKVNGLDKYKPKKSKLVKRTIKL